MSAPPGSPGERLTARRARAVLVVTIVVTGILYAVPGLRWLAWPLRLLSTLAHELGHGLAAVLVGGRFEALLMWSDGSGVATWTALTSRLSHAIIAAAGLLGPALAAAACFLLGRSPRGSRITLCAMGGGLVLADVLVVRTLFGVLFVALLAVVMLVVALAGRPWMSQVALILMGVQLALSVFSRGDYLFTPVARTEAGSVPSDVAQIAEALLLPYWFWGGAIAALSVLILGVALVIFLRAGPAADAELT